MEDHIAMFFKKSGNKSFSVTTESRKTVVSIDGKEVDMNDTGVDVDIKSLLRSQGIDTTHIPDEMLSDIAASLTGDLDSSTAVDSNATARVQCGACNRTVSFSKGNCIYCGHALALEEAADGEAKVDEKYLDTDTVEKRAEIPSTELHYIDRLKDI